ncbi:MAG TPA: hypothetical protein VHE09_15345 [Rhizomicrobium sp.]|jgi:hypothetical protein|nr:hypothetical protein [Rhizomicrobium sp.]
MKKTIFTAALFSTFLVAGGVCAQQSDQGTPNSLHGSGDMMQDGPHASANPNSDAETGMPRADKQEIKMKDCEKKWSAASANRTTGRQTHDQFMNGCMSSM